MGQRVGDLFDERLVELGVFAAHLQLDFLAELARNIVNDPAEAVEGLADLHHAQLQGTAAHFLDERGQHGKALFDLATAGAPGCRAGAGRGDDQLADAGNEGVEACRVDAQRGALAASRWPRRARGHRLGRRTHDRREVGRRSL